MTFKDRYGPWALIAGASEGFGAALARELAARSVNCALVARRAAPLDLLARELRDDFGVAVTTHGIDLTAGDAPQAMLDAIGDRQLGSFIYNAGADGRADRFVDVPFDAWSDLLRRNMLVMAQSVHAFTSRLAARGQGGVMLVSSEAAFCGAALAALYSATKAFGLTLGEALWAEMQPLGVDVLNVVLGATDTPATRARLKESGINPETIDLARAEDVARAAVEHLAHGPTYVSYARPDTTDPLISAPARRARVLASSAKFASFLQARTA